MANPDIMEFGITLRFALLGHGLAEWFRERMQGIGDMDEMMFGPQNIHRFSQLVLCHVWIAYTEIREGFG